VIEVELPDGTIAEFPDGTDDTTIARALAPYRKRKPEQPYSSVEGESAVDLALAGAGKSLNDTGMGVAQRVNDFLRYQTMGMVPGLEQGRQQIQQTIDQQRETDAPLMGTGAGLAGNIGGQVVQAMAMPGGAATLPGKFGMAAVQGGTFAATQPVNSDESLAGNTAMGAGLGALGQGVASGLGRVAKGASDLIDPAKLALIEKARLLGIPVNAAQVSDSRFMKTLASVVNKLPLSGGDKAAKAQGTAFTRAAAKTIGEDAEALTPEVMAAAKARIGGQFDQLATQSGVKVDDALTAQLTQIVDEAKRYSPDGAAAGVANIVEDLLSKADSGVIPGQAYQAFKTKLGQLARTPNNSLGGSFSAVQGALEDALGRSIPADAKGAWRSAREQWRNLKVLEKLAAKNSGSVPPAQLLSKLNAGKSTTAYGGGGELGDLARIGQGVLKDPIPNSGTPERQTVLGALGVGGGALAGFDPMTLAGGLAAGAGLGRAVNSQAFSRYLTGGMGKFGRTFLGAGRVAPYALPAAQRAAADRKKRKGLLAD
jgi:hypothetical protein